MATAQKNERTRRRAERDVLELFYDLVYVVLISQLAHAHSGHVNLAGAGGFVFLFFIVWLAWLNGAMWWIYFDFVSHHPPATGQGTVARWLYMHLPMTMGIAATGAAVLNVVERAGESLTSEVRWLLVGAIALALVCIAILMRTIQIPPEHYRIYRTGGIVTFISGLIILLLGFSGLSTIPLLVVLNLLMLAPIFYGLKVWIQMLGAEEIALT